MNIIQTLSANPDYNLRVKDTTTFIRKLNAWHPNKFDTSNSKYEGVRKDVSLKCKTCNCTSLFKPRNLYGSDSVNEPCDSCRKTKSSQHFKDRLLAVKKGKYVMTNTLEYINEDTKVEIYCNGCTNKFLVLPSNLLKSSNYDQCSICKGKATDLLTFQIKLAKLRPNKRITDNSIYLGNLIPI